MADIEITVKDLTEQLAVQEHAIKAAMAAGDMDEVNRIVMSRAPLLAQKARLVLKENKGLITVALDALKDMISEAVSTSGLTSLLGEDVEKISWFSEEGETYLNVNPKNLRRLPKTRAKKADSGIDEADKVFRVVDGKREDMTVGEAVQKFASIEVKATSIWEKGAWSTLFPKVNEELGAQKFSLATK